jgi:hypothetical protein
MASGYGNSKDNYSILLSTGAYLGPVPIEHEPEHSSLERIAKKTKVQPALLSINGLIRAHAAILYSELDRHLNPLTFRDGDILSLARMDEAEVASIERSPVYIRTAAESDYDILLQESEPGVGRFELEIKQGLVTDEDAMTFIRQLNLGFMAVMESINLKQAATELERLIAPGEAEGQACEVQYRRFSARNRLDKPIKVSPKRGESQQFRDDLQEMRMLMGIFAVEDAAAQPEKLIELWEKRGRNHIEMVNLFMYIVGRKQELRETPGAHFHYSVDDFSNYSPKHDGFELQNILAQRSRTVMSEKLRLTSGRIDYLYGLVDSDVDVSRLHYLAWLAGYPGMPKTATEMRKLFNQEVENSYEMMGTMQRLFQTASKELRGETLLHRMKMSEDYWSDYGAIDYDKEIPDELDAYNVKLLFLRSAWLLGGYLFTKEKLDTYMQKALQ